ncbi:ABC transporter permease subunit [Saccharopolyspora erythraea]|uniref:ABC transporter permease n=1 Tax=Saccharopolyspora erythraea TaxID=1836 RepID=UPI001BAE38F6|nr:ABC transporter permease subunit [Saccharopolyspora erythraea]QUH04786.1 ABC transporter permease subunit [Saccharopolyspora erythraea]
MAALIRAELRKIFSVNLWWALLLPVAVLSFGAGWLGTAFGTVASLEQEIGGPLPLGLLTVSMSTNFSTVFAALFGGLAVSGEYRTRSITTTYLTANPRGAVLGAKLVTYAAMGVLFGLVNVLFSSAGGLVGAGLDGFGDPGDWFTVGGAGLLAMVLWTLLGVGFGALVSSPVVVIITLLVYKFVFEFIVSTAMVGATFDIGPYLPGAAGNGIVGNLAVPIFIAAAAGPHEAETPKEVFQVLHFIFGGTYDHPWWASLLTFCGYTAVFCVAGWLVSRRRDIT